MLGKSMAEDIVQGGMDVILEIGNAGTCFVLC